MNGDLVFINMLPCGRCSHIHSIWLTEYVEQQTFHVSHVTIQPHFAVQLGLKLSLELTIAAVED